MTALLLTNAWRGNVRELQACIERLVVMGKTAQVEVADVQRLPSFVMAPVFDGVEETGFVSLQAKTMEYVERVLAHTGGDKARAAAILGVNVSTLYRWRSRAT